MPFEQTFNHWTDEPNGYTWTVDQEIVDDLSILDLTITTKLKIEPSGNSRNRLPRIPSLDVFNTGHLDRLEISDMDVQHMPRIPESVRVLVFSQTNMSNLTQINVDWKQIKVLELHLNPNLDGISMIVPEGIETLVIRRNWIDIIRLPSTITSFYSDNLIVNQLTGHLPNCTILFGYNSQYPKYWMGYNLINQQVDIEMDDVDGEEESNQVSAKWVKKLGYHIQCVNDAENARLYAGLAEIKHRIRNPVIHRENPIVEALFLGSNYLRRAAEFMTEETIVA